MAIRKSVCMMTNTNTKRTVISDPVRADAYYGYTDGVMTVQVIYQNFVGGFGIQATLSLDPKPEDWFNINLNVSGAGNSDYMMFPVDPLAPTGENGGDTGSFATTFIGNFVFLRAVLNRDYIQPASANPQWQSWQWGQLDTVLLSL